MIVSEQFLISSTRRFSLISGLRLRRSFDLLRTKNYKGEAKMVQINHPAPDFDLEAYHANDIVRINLNDYRGKWVVLFFLMIVFTDPVM